MTTTVKSRNFNKDPLRLHQSLADLPGVGEVGHKCLMAAGISNTNQLLGKFLMLDCNEDDFSIWCEGQGVPKAHVNKLTTAIREKWAVLVEH